MIKLGNKNEIHVAPTSLLIYHRLYTNSSPFGIDTIDGELRRRRSIRLVRPLKTNFIDKAKRFFVPKYIDLEEETKKCRVRGEGLEKYYFDFDDDVCTLLASLLSLVKNRCSSDDPIVVSQELVSTLTWTEQALLDYIAISLTKILENRQKSFTTNSWTEIIAKKQERKLLALLDSYIGNLTLSKISEARDEYFTQNSSKKISSLDALRYTWEAFKEQERQEHSYLDETIDALSNSQNIAMDIKRMIYKPR